MSDNPKKKKLDGKRIAFGQMHEINYCRKIAKKMSVVQKEHLNRPVYVDIGGGDLSRLTNLSSINRLAKAFLETRRLTLKSRHVESYWLLAKELLTPFVVTVDQVKIKGKTIYKFGDKELRIIQSLGSKAQKLAKAFLEITERKCRR